METKTKNPIEIHYTYLDRDLRMGFIEKIILPNKEVVEFDEEKGCIDFEPMTPYVGEELAYYIDGKFQKKYILQSIDTYPENNLKYFTMGEYQE